uniref:Uncharacterized protein n=1 Tax=Molossus molossus TaxID=27622 RepID=A0A7J8GQK8_MOLMO|nr:hypothetical protein HJG59_011265 [Molossus molossus]
MENYWVITAGRYLLEDDATESMLTVTVTGLQRQDLGLYQCVIDLSPQKPRVLPPQIRLAQCEGEHGESPDGRVVEAEPLSHRPGPCLPPGLLWSESTEDGEGSPLESERPGLPFSRFVTLQVIAPLWTPVFSPVKARELD